MRISRLLTLFRRPQEARCRTRAPAAVLGHLQIAEAFLMSTVEVGVARIATSFRRRDEGIGDRIGFLRIGHVEFTIGAMVVVGAALLALALAEIGQDVLVAPADVAELAPVIVILALAADVDETVDRRRAAKDLAAWLFDAAAAGVGVRLRGVEPVHLGDC